MKKMIVALLLVVPLLFLLTVFSIAGVGSLNVQIPVNGIEIKNDLDGKTLYIDLSDYDDDYRIEVAVYPMNAANKKYSFEVNAPEGGDFADISVSEDGVVSARSLGNAVVTVRSHDGGYTDNMNVVVGSSRALDVVPVISGSEGGENLLVRDGDVYKASVTTGIYSYSANLLPATGEAAKVSCLEGFALVNEAAGTVSLPFGGKCVLEFSVGDGNGGKLARRAELEVSKLANASGILVNGNDLFTVAVDSVSRKGECYIASDSQPSLAGADAVFLENVEVEEIEQGKYKMTFTVAEGSPSRLNIILSAGLASQVFYVSVGQFSYSLRYSLPVQTGEDVTVVAGSSVNFFAVTSAAVDDVEFVWSTTSAATVKYAEGATCEVDGLQAGTYFTLTCEAFRNGTSVGVKKINASVVNAVSAAVFGDRRGAGLAEQTAIAEYTYKDGKISATDYVFDFRPYSAGGVASLEDFDFSLSDERVAEIRREQGKLTLVPLSTGEVTLTATWKGSQNYGSDVTAKYTFTVVKDGVSVTDSDGFFAVVSQGKPLVVNADITLGTDADGNAYPVEKLSSMLGTMKSTYNTDFLINNGMETTVRYVAEFKNDVYGNGYTVNAEKFTTASDATGIPLLFKGALPLVGVYADKSLAMKVSAQDNIAFLIRTDGVTVSNVNLTGCGDEAIAGEDGVDLAKLNNVGTVLDVNADCNILNCRIRNGKNCVRVYGGNREGNDFFRTYIDGSDVNDRDRIVVRMEGCVLSQAREFLVKTGANRALRSSMEGGDEPDLLKADGSAYSQFDDLTGDRYFYDKYVLTDLTVKDCVLEKSGLFAIGFETNFSGSVLNGEKTSGYDFAKSWGVGGTSYGTVVKIEGDVRFYDWKSIENIDSSQLVEVFSGGIFDAFVLDIRKMIETVVENAQAHGDHSYDDIFASDADGQKYVNSAMVKYGGGKNFTVIDMSALDEELNDFSDYRINISVLTTSGDQNISQQGEFLPLAAGTQDFLFRLYSAQSENSLSAQLAAYENGTAYDGIKPVRQ